MINVLTGQQGSFQNTNPSDSVPVFSSDLSLKSLFLSSGEWKPVCQQSEVIPLVSNSVHLFQEFSGNKCEDLKKKGRYRQIASCVSRKWNTACVNWHMIQRISCRKWHGTETNEMISPPIHGFTLHCKTSGNLRLIIRLNYMLMAIFSYAGCRMTCNKWERLGMTACMWHLAGKSWGDDITASNTHKHTPRQAWGQGVVLHWWK